MAIDVEICTKCGKKTKDLTVVDDETRLCSHCLGDLDECAICGEYWDSEYVEMHHLKDGRYVCDYCYEDLEGDEAEEADDD